MRSGDVEALFHRHGPNVVFHAEVPKHVPLMEAHREEAIMNNVIGSRNSLVRARVDGEARFVNVSTATAINPARVMGASKRVVACLLEDAAGVRAMRSEVSPMIELHRTEGARA